MSGVAVEVPATIAMTRLFPRTQWRSATQQRSEEKRSDAGRGGGDAPRAPLGCRAGRTRTLGSPRLALNERTKLGDGDTPGSPLGIWKIHFSNAGGPVVSGSLPGDLADAPPQTASGIPRSGESVREPLRRKGGLAFPRRAGGTPLGPSGVGNSILKTTKPMTTFGQHSPWRFDILSTWVKSIDTLRQVNMSARHQKFRGYYCSKISP